MVVLGASEAPAVLGVSPFETPWHLWARKVGLIPEETREAEILTWGTRLETVVIEGFLRDRGLWVDYMDQSFLWSPWSQRFHPGRPWQRATPDFFAQRALPLMVECKCVRGDPPTSPRVEWLVQCVHQRMVYDIDNVTHMDQYLVAYGNLSLEWWEIPFHQRAADRVLREEGKFLELIEREEPPPVRAEDASVLAKGWPYVRHQPVRLVGEEVVALDKAYATAHRLAKQWQGIKDESEARLKALIADAPEAVLDNGTVITWRPHQRRRGDPESGTVRPFRRRGEESDDEDVSGR